MTTGTTTTIDLLRHGKPENDGCLSGRTDALLTETGWQQMRQTMSQPERYDIIVSSPLKRCSVFAVEFSNQHAVELDIETQSQEMSFGKWDGMSYEKLHKQYPKALNDFWSDPWCHTPPEGESIESFINRVTDVWQLLLKKHQGKNILLVTHSGVIRQVIAHILAMDTRKGLAMSRLDIAHGSLTRIEVYTDDDGQQWPRLMFMNQKSHPLGN